MPDPLQEKRSGNDWQLYVRERIGTLGIGAEREEEVVAELAGHFEDAYEGFLERSGAPQHAFTCAFFEVTNWSRLRREIRRVKQEDPMNERTKNLWLPGMVMLFLYAFLLRIVIWAGFHPDVVWVGPSMPMLQHGRLPLVLYVPWLVLLPAIGALGAWWSRRVGGAVLIRILSGLFPVAALLALLLVGFLFAFFADPQVPLLVKFAGLGLYFLTWVLIPGALLLLGTVPFVLDHSKESRRVSA